MLRPADDNFLDELGAEICEANGCRISRSEIISAGLAALKELHKLQGKSAAFVPFTACRSGSDLELLVVVGIRGVVDLLNKA